MDTTIRNLDERLYREMKGRAALTGRTLGQVVNEAMAVYLSRPPESSETISIADIEPLPFPSGEADLSERVDAIVYDQDSSSE
jgi:plasmid stability protein